ncbi:MAG: hypothetical protein ACI9RO_000813 [Alteromonas macleodii]|jgi:hypothetical protein
MSVFGPQKFEFDVKSTVNHKFHSLDNHQGEGIL